MPPSYHSDCSAEADQSFFLLYRLTLSPVSNCLCPFLTAIPFQYYSLGDPVSSTPISAGSEQGL